MTAFHLKPSYLYLSIWLSLILLSFAAVFILSITIIVKIICILLISCYSYFILHRYILLRDKKSVVALHYHRKAMWLIQLNDGETVAKLLGDSTVTGIISILRFEIPHKRFPIACIIWRDSMQLGHYRQMMMCAKLG